MAGKIVNGGIAVFERAGSAEIPRHYWRFVAFSRRML
jgi:hypothetical protein